MEMLDFYHPKGRHLPENVLQDICALQYTSAEDMDVQFDAIPDAKPQPFKLFPTSGEFPTVVYGIHQLAQGFLAVVLNFMTMQFSITLCQTQVATYLDKASVISIAKIMDEWLARIYNADSQKMPAFPHILGFHQETPLPQYAALLLVLQSIIGFTAEQLQQYWQRGYQETLASLLDTYKQQFEVVPKVPTIRHAIIERRPNARSFLVLDTFIRHGTKYMLPENEVERIQGKATTDDDAIILALYYLSPLGKKRERSFIFSGDVVGFIYSFKLLESSVRHSRDDSPRRSATTTALVSGTKITVSEPVLRSKFQQINATAKLRGADLPPGLQLLEKDTRETSLIPGRKRPRTFIRLTDRGAQHAEHLLGFRERPTSLVSEIVPKRSCLVIVDLVAKYGAMNKAEIMQKYITLMATNTEEPVEISNQNIKFLVINAVKTGELTQEDGYLYLTSDPAASWRLRHTLRNRLFQSRVIVETDFGKILMRAIKQCFVEHTGLVMNDIYVRLYQEIEFKHLTRKSLEQVLDQMTDGKTPTLICWDKYYFRAPPVGAQFDADELYKQCNEGWVEDSFRRYGFTISLQEIQTAFVTGKFSEDCQNPTLSTDAKLCVKRSTLPFENVGMGLFSKYALPKDTLIEVVGLEQLRDINDHTFLPYGFSFPYKNQTWELDCKPPGKTVTCLAAMANDGLLERKANMEQHLVEGLHRRLFLRLLEAVPADTELLWSYGEDYWEAFREYQSRFSQDEDFIYGDLDDCEIRQEQETLVSCLGWSPERPSTYAITQKVSTLTLSDENFMCDAGVDLNLFSEFSFEAQEPQMYFGGSEVNYRL